MIVLQEDRGAVRLITLNRPEKRHAINAALAAQRRTPRGGRMDRIDRQLNDLQGVLLDMSDRVDERVTYPA